jgi:hypothetical protein
VKPNLYILLAALGLTSFAAGQDSPPPPLAPLPTVENPEIPATVAAAAVDAVTKLGEQVVLGRFRIAIERMNPMWKDRTAKRMGGMEELERQLDGVAQQMVQQGISMLSFRPEGQPRAFEVWPGKKVDIVNGKEVESLIYTKWMVFVPTVTRFRIIREGNRPLIIDSIAYQVAITEKDQNDWTFIDGSGLTLNELRSLFTNLPQDLTLPPVEKREVP